MRLQRQAWLLLAAGAARPAYAAHGCPLLDADPFRLKGVRKAVNVWTADVYLKEWTPGETLTFKWKGPMHVTEANHADIIEQRADGAVVRLQDDGPDDGKARVMLHMDGLRVSTPTISCEEYAAAYYDDDGGDDDSFAPYRAPLDSLLVASADSEEQLPLARTELPCADELTDLSLTQMADTSAMGCDEIGLRLPEARLCSPGDQLSLLWLRPGSSLWVALQESLPSGQPQVALDGLSPTAEYQFRLRLSLADSDTVRLGRPSGPMLVDGASFVRRMDPGGPALQPLPSSSSSIQLPWPLVSLCRPAVPISIRVLPKHATQPDWPNAQSVSPSEVDVEDGALQLKRLRCPLGCILSISPYGITGNTMMTRLSLPATTPLLSPVPPNGCRIEIRLHRTAGPPPTDKQMQEGLAADFALAIHTRPEQLRLVEQRLGGQFAIIDLLVDSTSPSATQATCDAFADATRPLADPHDPRHAAGSTNAVESTLWPGSQGYKTLSRFMPAGGVTQLIDNPSAADPTPLEVLLAPWLLPEHHAATHASGVWTKEGRGGADHVPAPINFLAHLIHATFHLVFLLLVGALALVAAVAARGLHVRKQGWQPDAIPSNLGEDLPSLYHTVATDERVLAAVRTAASLGRKLVHAVRSSPLAEAAGAQLGSSLRLLKAKVRRGLAAVGVESVASEWYSAVGRESTYSTADVPAMPPSPSMRPSESPGLSRMDSEEAAEALAEAEAGRRWDADGVASPTGTGSLAGSGVDAESHAESEGSSQGSWFLSAFLQPWRTPTIAQQERQAREEAIREETHSAATWTSAKPSNPTSPAASPSVKAGRRTPPTPGRAGSSASGGSGGSGGGSLPANMCSGAAPSQPSPQPSSHQRVHIETLDGRSEAAICPIYANDAYPEVEARLRSLGNQVLGLSGQLSISVQYYNVSSCVVDEAHAETAVAHMMEASEWRVLVLGSTPYASCAADAAGAGSSPPAFLFSPPTPASLPTPPLPAGTAVQYGEAPMEAVGLDSPVGSP